VGDTEIRAELLLEGLDLAPEDEDAAVEDVLDRPVDLGLYLAILGWTTLETEPSVSPVVVPITLVVLDGPS
jgi:hypothetical protein